MIKPILKASWRKDPEGTFRVFIRGKEHPADIQVQVESRSGSVKLVTLIGTHSQVSDGYMYWYKPITATSAAPTADIRIAEAPKPHDYGDKVTLEELDAALGL